MARPARFTDDEILDGALRAVIVGGVPGATVSRIAAEAGAPVGSIYHRFTSREVLLARLWLRTSAEFQAGAFAVLEGPDPVEAGRDTTRYVVRWCRRRPAEAALLLVHHRDDFLADGWPAELRDQAAAMRRQADDGLRRFTSRRLGGTSRGAQQRVWFALVDIPIAAVRRYLMGGESPPAMIEDLVVRAHDAVLAD